MWTRDISNRRGTQKGNHSKKDHTQNPLEAKAQASLGKKKTDKPLRNKSPSTLPTTRRKGGKKKIPIVVGACQQQ
jgi:hypothetical protein